MACKRSRVRLPSAPFPRVSHVIAVLLLLGGCGNELVLRLPDPRVRVISFGDSTTQGPARHDYVDDLPGLLGEPAESFAKEGRGGETAQASVNRMRSIFSLGLFPSAKVLVYWDGAAGLIDFVKQHDPLFVLSPDDASFPFTTALDQKLQDIQNGIESALKIPQEAGLQVFVATYYSMVDSGLQCDPLLLKVLLPQQETIANQYVTRLNDRIRRAAANRSAILVDIALSDSTLKGNLTNYFNCNHLSAAGNDFVAGLIAQALQDHPPPN